jgi:hypothetical protein
VQITSTTYIDFLLATGLARVSKVRDARRQYEGGYSQGSDFYRPMREGIITMHREGHDTSFLDQIVADTLPQRRAHYRACADGYRKFMRDKQFVWTRRPKPDIWKHGGLQVLVNPELLLTVDGRPHRVKLYFKGENLRQSRADLLIELLKSAGDDGTAAVGMLDVRRSKLFIQKKYSPDFPVLLRSEALSFAAMWQAVGPQAQQRPATG